MLGLAQSDLNYDFYAYNASNQVWGITGTASFRTFVAADYLNYRIAATKVGDASDEDIQAWFSAADIDGAVRWEMRERGASLALSPIVYIGPDVTETVVANADTTATLAAAIKAKTDLIGTIRSLIRW